MLPLWLTSNNVALRILGGKKWKALHRIVYVLFAVAMFHQMLSRGIRTGAPDRYMFVALTQAVLIVFIYASLKFFAWKKTAPFLNDTIAYIAARYATYVVDTKGRRMT